MRHFSSWIAKVRPTTWGCLGSVLLASGLLTAWLLPSVQRARDSARMAQLT